MSLITPDPTFTLDEKQQPDPPLTFINNSPQDAPISSSVGGAQVEKFLALASIEPPAPPRPVHGVRLVLVVIAILSSTFLFSLDNTVVSDMQSTIVRQFGSVDELTWLSVGYLLGSTTTNLL